MARKLIRLENDIPVTPVEVFADESELEQVMLSLLGSRRARGSGPARAGCSRE